MVLAVRERTLPDLVETLVDARLVPKRAVVVHVSGALDATVLAPLRAVCAGVAQMHPMMSFASKRFAPGLRHGNVLTRGDRVAVARAQRIARALGMTPRAMNDIEGVAYHAAAGLVANGAAALSAAGAEILERAGVPHETAPKMLGPLLRSVADNVEALGFPGALTGPVRRGDLAGVEKHLTTLRSALPRAVGIYLASVGAQLPLARALGDAPPEQFDAIERLVAGEARRFARSARED